MLFTVAIFIISAVQLLVAAAIYPALLCYIQGNLKEYCCHKVDKRSVSFLDRLRAAPKLTLCSASPSLALPPCSIAELMKRKNRRRLAKEAEYARREAAGDFRHLKDKSGKLVNAPRPQPTLPKIGLNASDLYPETASMHGQGASGGGDKHSYPPSGIIAPVLPYANAGPYGLSHPPPHQQHYPLGYGDSDSLHGHGSATHGYAESVTSVDGLTARAQPMGYSHGPADSTSTLPYPGGGGIDMSRAPSYRTNPSSRDLLAGDGYAAEPSYDDKVPGAPYMYPAHDGGYGGEPIPHDSLSQRAGTGGEYGAPPRRLLFERAARHNAAESFDGVSAVGMAGSDFGHARGPSGSHGGGGYGGWEESGPGAAAVPDEGVYRRAPSRGMQRAPSGNGAGGFAGRGAYGRGYR